MYEFYYKYIKNEYDVNLLFTDTDSLVYQIETEDIYEDFYKDKNLFDFSDYPLHSKFFNPAYKKVIGKKLLTRIQSKLHRIGTYNLFKIPLPCFDDKRYILDDDINNLTYFHKDIRTNKNE